MRRKKLPPQAKRCQMKAGTKEQCRAPRQWDSEFCFFHDPEAQAERMQLGGKLMRLRWLNPSDLHDYLVRTTEAVRRKRLDPQRAYAISCLVKQIQENLPAVDKELREHRQSGYVGWNAELVEKRAWEELEANEQYRAEEEKEEEGKEEGEVQGEEEGEQNEEERAGKEE